MLLHKGQSSMDVVRNETIDHPKYHRLAQNLWQSLHEVHDNVARAYVGTSNGHRRLAR